LSQASLGAQEGAGVVSREGLKDLVAEAISKSPSIKARKGEYEAARSRVLAAWLPDDPEFGIDVEGQPEIFQFDERTDTEYSLTQSIPFPTKLILRGVIASKEAGILYGRYKEEEARAVRTIAELYFDLFLFRKTLESLEGEEAIFDQMLRASQGRYEGGARQEDLLRIEIERKRGEIEIFRLKENARVFEERLSLALGRPLATSYLLKEPQKSKNSPYSREAMDEIALKNRAELKAMEKGLERASAQAALDRTDWLPDVTLRYEGREPRGGTISEHDTFIGLSVPIFSLLKGISGTWRAAGAEEKVAKLLYEDAKKETLLRSHELYAKIKSSEYALGLYENSILSAARQQVDASLASYQAGKGSFLNLIDSLRTERQAKADYYRHLADAEAARIEFEALLGG
jgi:outer membrane protein TolC